MKKEIKIWDISPIIKIYEALGVIADKRVEITKEEGGLFSAKVYSSSGNKFYSVSFNREENALMVNDNGSWFIGYLGYPAIAVLMTLGDITFEEKYSEALKGIQWKDINQKFKNDFNKTKDYADEIMESRGIITKDFYDYTQEVLKELENKNYKHLGKKVFPPRGY